MKFYHLTQKQTVAFSNENSYRIIITPSKSRLPPSHFFNLPLDFFPVKLGKGIKVIVENSQTLNDARNHSSKFAERGDIKSFFPRRRRNPPFSYLS